MQERKKVTKLDVEVVARTILKEGFEKGSEGYDAIAWVIRNRSLQNVSYYGGNFATDICLHPGQFAVWKSVWGSTEIPSNPKSTSHPDYKYCWNLALKLCQNQNPTEHVMHSYNCFRSSKTANRQKKGQDIGENYFFSE